MSRDLPQVNAQDHGASVGGTQAMSLNAEAADPLALETAAAKTTRKTKKTETTETEG